MNPARKLEVKRLRSDKKMLSLISVAFLVIGFWLVGSSLTTIDRSISDSITAIVGMIILIFSTIFFVSPIFLENLITPNRLIIRYGFIFRLELPIGEIADAREIVRVGIIPLVLGMGVDYSASRRRIKVLRSRKGMVMLRLRREIILGRIFKQRIEEIFIDTVDSEFLIKSISQDRARR